jgi:polyisoprenoid-binding protein YceI
MKSRSLWLAVAAVVILAGMAVFSLWAWVLGPTQHASSPLTAIPLALTPDSTAVSTDSVAAGGAAATAPSPVSGAAGPIILRIDSASSEARFVLSEVLRGQQNTVVGATRQVAGEIAVVPGDLGATRVGVIQVNARSLATDNDRRNQAIRNRILNTDQYELITFTPTEVRGLSGSAAPGDTLTFQIAGDLTIRDVTRPVVFDVKAAAQSSGQVSGSAQATIQRSDFGLDIPNVPFVADVSQAVQLQIDFVASSEG